jgi:hypothetical protein
VELPDWVVDEVLAQAKPSAFRLVVMLFRHGRPQVGHQGERRVYWRGSKQQLARLIGASKRSLDEAERELVSLHFLTVHTPVAARFEHAISVPLERERSRLPGVVTMVADCSRGMARLTSSMARSMWRSKSASLQR